MRIGGTGAYGSGLVRVFVVPLRHWQLRDRIDSVAEARSTEPERLPNATVLFLETSLVGAGLVASDDGERAYMIAGTVGETVLREVATELLANPPERA
jgi:hypothetical protein